jgi:hypothetical protein
MKLFSFTFLGLVHGVIFSVIFIAAVVFSVSQEDLLKVVHTRNSYTGIPRSRYYRLLWSVDPDSESGSGLIRNPDSGRRNGPDKE